MSFQATRPRNSAAYDKELLKFEQEGQYAIILAEIKCLRTVRAEMLRRGGRTSFVRFGSEAHRNPASP